jgi:hypothetical protein
MRIKDWLKAGIKVKRWLAFGIFGILLISFGFTELVNHRVYNLYYQVFYVFLILQEYLFYIYQLLKR